MRIIYKILTSILITLLLLTHLNVERNIYAQEEINTQEKATKSGTVGDAIANIFPDKIMAREVARHLNTTTSAILTQEMADSMEYFETMYNTITDISGIGIFTNLTHIYLSGNKLRFVPEEIGNLKKLKFLAIDSSDIFYIPDRIGELESLEELYIAYNNIKELPDSITNLSNLRKINMSGNPIEYLPENIGILSKLELLQANEMKLVEIPESIKNLESLIRLELFKNNLTTLPNGLYEIPNLRTLNLQNNQIDSLSENIANLSLLSYLNIASNELVSLPDSITSMQNLKALDVSDNLLTSLPNNMDTIINLPQNNRFKVSLNLLPSFYADTFNEIATEIEYTYEQQKQIHLLYKVDPIKIDSLADIENINLSSLVRLGRTDKDLSALNFKLENYVDENGNSVNVEDYISNGVVVKNGSVFAQIRATGEGMFPNNSDRALTSKPIELVFEKTKYVLTFDLNGAPGEVPSELKLEVGQVAPIINTPSRDGYAFKGWNTQSDGSGVDGILGESTMPAKNVKLYAIWKQSNNSNVATVNPQTTLPTTGSSLNILGIVSILVIALIVKRRIR